MFRRILDWLFPAEPEWFTSGSESCDYLERLRAVPPAEVERHREAA